MRGLGVIVVAAGLAGCGADESVTDLGPIPGDPEEQARACATAVAAHTGLPLDAMRPEWTGLTDTGTDIFFVHHGSTLHTCEVDGAARVLELQHPDE